VLVLKTLSWGPMHAFEIAKWLEERSVGKLSIEDAALMQALHRLEERAILAVEWGVTNNGRRARYYRLTNAGRVHLRAESRRLTDYAETLALVLATRSVEG
jgi:PadR family transcriptional regulator, regulatory protein PadR